MCRWSRSAFILLPIRPPCFPLNLALHDTFSVEVQPQGRCCEDLDPFSAWILFSLPCICLVLLPFSLQSLRAAPLRLITCFFIFKPWLLAKFNVLLLGDRHHSWPTLSVQCLSIMRSVEHHGCFALMCLCHVDDWSWEAACLPYQEVIFAKFIWTLINWGTNSCMTFQVWSKGTSETWRKHSHSVVAFSEVHFE